MNENEMGEKILDLRDYELTTFLISASKQRYCVVVYKCPGLSTMLIVLVFEFSGILTLLLWFLVDNSSQK
jgi:hypothetical protein